MMTGNLSVKVTKEDLMRHFGLDSTPYLRSSSWIELAVERSGNSQGFGFINVPEHLAGKVTFFSPHCFLYSSYGSGWENLRKTLRHFSVVTLSSIPVARVYDHVFIL